MKKTILILTIVFAALAAWVVAFPSKNPFNKLFGSNATPGAKPVTERKTQFGLSPAPKPSVFNPDPAPVQDARGFPLMKSPRVISYVKVLQNALNKNYGTDLVVDGIFGMNTYRAISTFGFNADALSYAEYMKIVNG